MKTSQEVKKITLESLSHFSEKALALLKHKDLLRFLIKRTVIEAICEEVELPKDIVNNTFISFLKQKDLKTKRDLKLYLEKKGNLREKDLKDQINLPLKMKICSLKQFGSKAELHFMDRKDDLDQFTYSLLRLKDSDLAYELYLQIEASERDFREMAKSHSLGPERHSCGVIGPNSLKKTNPLLKQKLLAAKEGVLMEPLKLGDWWVIIRLEEKISAKFNEQMKEIMSMELFDSWVEDIANEVMLDMKTYPNSTEEN